LIFLKILPEKAKPSVRVGRKATGLLDKIMRRKAATIDGWFAEMDGNLAFSLLGSTLELEADFFRSGKIIRLLLNVSTRPKNQADPSSPVKAMIIGFERSDERKL
jgi:hypothetical protein